MSRQSEREATSVEVIKLDLDKYCKGLLKDIKKKKGFEDITGASVRESFGLVKTPKGTFLVSTEGILYTEPVTDEKPAEFDIYTNKESSFSMFPNFEVKVGLTDLAQYEGEKINLASFIRTFGRRLESNYSGAKSFLEAASKPAKKKAKKA